jgi:hypothetical protein
MFKTEDKCIHQNVNIDGLYGIMHTRVFLRSYLVSWHYLLRSKFCHVLWNLLLYKIRDVWRDKSAYQLVWLWGVTVQCSRMTSLKQSDLDFFSFFFFCVYLTHKAHLDYKRNTNTEVLLIIKQTMFDGVSTEIYFSFLIVIALKYNISFYCDNYLNKYK